MALRLSKVSPGGCIEPPIMSLGDFIAKNPFLASYSHKNRCFGLRENQELDSSFSRVKRYGHQLQSSMTMGISTG